MIEDHTPLTVTTFRGLYGRGDDEVVPRGFWASSQNNQFFKSGFETRDGSQLHATLSTVKRAVSYKRIGEADRLLLLDGSGNLYDSTNLGAPILSIAEMTDFSCVVLYNRAYITPHNGSAGLPGQFVYVYGGSGVAIAAAGAAPTGFTLAAANSATSGTVEAGYHIIAVANVTVTGYVTGIGGHVAFNAVGSRKLDISNILTGPANIAQRVLVATKVIEGFNGDVDNQTYYFVPNGTINDNISTTKTIDFYDADLQEEASYLTEQIAGIPAGLGIAEYNGRMIVWGEDANPSIVRVSLPGEPESISQIEGYLTVRPGDSTSGVRNCASFRNQIIIFKDRRAYVTVDNGEEPAFWEVDELDMSVGTECHGIAKIMDKGNTVDDYMIVASRAGCRLFNGSFLIDALSYNIESWWDRINRFYFHTVEVVIDSEQSKIYIAAPLDAATSPDCVFVADYSDGWTPDLIRWDIWRFPIAPTTIAVIVDTASKKPQLIYASVNVYKIVEGLLSDFGNAIDAYAKFALEPETDDQGRHHFGGVRFKARGSGTLLLDAYSSEDAITESLPSLTLSVTSGANLFRQMVFENEKCSIRVRVNAVNDWYRITKYTLFAKLAWLTRPE